MNTATVHHPALDWVFDLCRAFGTPQDGGVDTNNIDRADIPEEKVLAYIQDVIPGVKPTEILEPQAWKCPEQDLPTPRFEEGDLVVWNDKYIAPTHGARISFKGDDTFTVRIVDDFIVALIGDKNGKLTTQAPRTNRIALETPSGRIIIAHPGYFKLLRG